MRVEYNPRFLGVRLPEKGEGWQILKKEWQALNENEAVDLGVLSDEENLSSDRLPALQPSEKPVPWQPSTRIGTQEGTFSVWGEAGGVVSRIPQLRYALPLALFSDGTHLIVFYNATPNASDSAYYLDIISDEIILTLDLRRVQNSRGQDLGYDRSPFRKDRLPTVLSHNLVTNLQSLTQSEWNAYLTMLPGFFYLPREIYLGRPSATVAPNAWYMKVTETEGTLQNTFYQSSGDTWRARDAFPLYVFDPEAVDYTTRDRFGVSHLGRIFAAGDGVVSSTCYNSFRRTLDTAEEYRDANGWLALLSSRSEGETVTALASYRSRVVVFKKHFMHEVSGTKNPFRVSDVGAVGCIDHRSVSESDGMLFFVSEDGVRVYTGDALPEIISEPLAIRKFYEAVAGSYDHKYYVWGRGSKADGEEVSFLYVYDILHGVWTKEASPAEKIVGFARTAFGFFALGSDGILYKMDSGDYSDQHWFAQTDCICDRNVDVKHMEKAELFLEASAGSTLSVYLLKEGEAFDPETSCKVWESEFTTGGEKHVRFHLRRGAFVAARVVIAGVGKVILRHMNLRVRKGGSGHAVTPREGMGAVETGTE